MGPHLTPEEACQVFSGCEAQRVAQVVLAGCESQEVVLHSPQRLQTNTLEQLKKTAAYQPGITCRDQMRCLLPPPPLSPPNPLVRLSKVFQYLHQ